jgi:hypothetical protein
LKDLLDVWIGKVKVYIQHLPGIPNPNNVSSPTAVISVRGTVFEVSVEDQDGTTFVRVDEGLVLVRSKAPAGGEKLLQPTESIRVFKDQPLAQQMDKGSIARAIARALQDAARVALQRQAGGGGGLGTPPTTPGTGAQGDKGKGGTTTGGGTTTAPAPPSAPPPPPPAP